MAKQNLSKKGVQRFNRKKLPKDSVRKNQNLRLQHQEKAQSRAQQQQQASKQQKADGKRKGGDPQALPLSFVRGKQVLLVGEGNLSFAHALVTHVLGGDGTGVTATTYDTEEEVTQARVTCHCVAFGLGDSQASAAATRSTRKRRPWQLPWLTPAPSSATALTPWTWADA